MSWRGSCFLSHDTNLNSGVVILFSQCLYLRNVSTCETEQPRIRAVEAERKIQFIFINIYAHNHDTGQLFCKLHDRLKQ